MRTFLAPAVILAQVAFVFSANPTSATAQIDLTKWTVEDYAGGGVWTQTKYFAEFVNNNNYDISVLYSDAPIPVIDFNLKVATASDDDFVGFVIGFQPGDSTNANCDFLLVDWKQKTQTFSNWGTAQEGLAVSRVQGLPTVGTVPGMIDFWSHTLNTTELARGTKYGGVGWADNTSYKFRVIFTGASLDIWIDGVQEFQLTGNFNMGRFGCYNFSQTKMEFSFPNQGSFDPLGQGCQGTAGTPYLFSPRAPKLGEDLIAVVANIPTAATSSFILGLSNSTWGSIPLPLDMGLLGATGCTLYTSADFLIPITNFNGTGVLILPIPNDPTLARFLFYGQVMVNDSQANPLGLVFSNAATAIVGN